MLNELKNLQLDRLDLDEIVALYGLGDSIRKVNAEYGLPQPEWLTTNLETLQKEIKSKRRDSLERALKLAKARKEQLKTIDERRKDTEAEIERLEQALVSA